MDVTCETCLEPWELYGLVHEDLVLVDAEQLQATSVYRKINVDANETWWFVAPEGLDEAAEGCLELFGCPACPNGGEPSDATKRRLGLT